MALGVYTTVSEICDSKNSSKSYVSRLSRLALLAPDIVEVILDGRARSDVVLERLGEALPAEWKAQRSLLARFSDG